MPAQEISVIDLPGPSGDDRSLSLQVDSASYWMESDYNGLLRQRSAYRWLKYPPEMSNPPTITTGDADAASSIASGVLVTPNTVPTPWQVLRHDGFFQVGDMFFPVQFAQTQAPCAIEFMFDGAEFEIKCRGDEAYFRIIVDGEYNSYTPTATPGSGNRFIHVDFASASLRHIRLEFYLLAWRGIVIPPTATIYAANVSPGPRVIMLGDSFLGGVDGIGCHLGNYMGWPDVWEAGIGGTGYLTTNGAYKSLPDRLSTDLYPHNPDVCIIAMGINDGSHSAASVGEAAAQVFSNIRGTLPDCTLIVVGPWWHSGNPSQATIDRRNAIESAATAEGVHLFIDNIGSESAEVNALGWMTGTGNAGDPSGDGNSDIYISADATHPTAEGRLYLGQRLASSILAAMPILHTHQGA